MQMMITASDLGIGTGHPAVGDQDLARAVLGLPQDRLAASCSTSGIRPTGR